MENEFITLVESLRSSGKLIQIKQRCSCLKSFTPKNKKAFLRDCEMILGSDFLLPSIIRHLDEFYRADFESLQIQNQGDNSSVFLIAASAPKENSYSGILEYEIVTKISTEATPSVSDVNTSKSKNVEDMELRDIYVGDLSSDVTEDDVRNCFSVCGEIKYIHLFKDSHTGNLRAYAFVNFASNVAKERALSDDFSNILIKGKQCKVKPGEQKTTLFVGNLPLDMNKEDIKFALSAICKSPASDISSIELKTGPPPNYESRGFCFVQYISHAKAEKARIILEKNSVKERPLNITWAEKSNTREVDQATMLKVKTLYVSNLNISANEPLLHSVFQPYGNLNNVVIIRNPTTKQSRGFAFIEFEKREQALTAIQYLNGTDLLGQSMNITLAVPASPKPKKSNSSSSSKSDSNLKSSQRSFTPQRSYPRFHPYQSFAQPTPNQYYEDPYYQSNYYNNNSQVYDPSSSEQFANYYSNPYLQDNYKK